MSDQKNLSFTEFRARIGDLRGKEFWRSLEELSRSDAFDDFFAQEFPQQAVPLEKGVHRRDFMKLMGASVAMAGLAACRQPADAIVPYVNQPENLVPGKPLFFATAMPLGGVASGILVESHLNRPTKIEGNPDHPSTMGASDAFMQASVLGLYDPDRSQVIRKLGDTATWGDFIGALQPVLNAAKTNGGSLRILTQTVSSPTFGAQMQRLLAQYPGMKWHQWEAVNRDGVREGGRLAFGRYVSTHYDFTKANVVVSLGSDFLGEGPGHLRYARDFMSRRKVRSVGVTPTTSMNRLYAIEGSMSQTGSVADHRMVIKPSQMEATARAILNGQGTSPVLAAIAKDLQANRGASIVIAGDEQPPVIHALAHAINTQLGNIGATVLVTESIEAAPTNQLASVAELVRDMNAGAVNALIILGGNPVFDAPADLQFTKALEKVPFRAHQSLYYDETSLRCHWHIPEAHFLETWGDVRAHDGTVSIIQPLISPLYNGRSAHEILGALIGGLDETPYQTVRNYWNTQGATDATWRKWLHDGLIAGSALPPVAAVAAAAPAATPAVATSGIEIELRHDPTIYDGRFANNGWLQELPKPQTKITWDNVLIVSPKTADKIGYNPEVRDALVNEKKTRFAEVSYRGVTMQLPLWVVPGYAEDVATIYFGHGREKGGKIGTGTGFNTYPLRFSNALHGGAGARITMASEIYPVACTQEHQSIDPNVVGERGLIRAATFEGYKKNPHFAQDPHHGSDVTGHGDESMYPHWDYSDKHAWAMVIDTSVCTGCNGCVIACQSENNIAIVGKAEVLRERELHWLRIDRYFRGDVDNPEVFHEPVPCMQCENAPCEPVCPVEATSHSEDGLNDMTYNRCVGTRYCSNNCPYKVRRFNFFGYSDYDTPSLKPMRNPDVTIRTRGVMEKCTYCVQRLNLAKIDAEKQGRKVKDGEVTTACAQACPTQAIVFGDMNDKTSAVAQLKAEPHHYALLEELQTRPRTTYLGTIRNPHPDLATSHQADTGHE